jgi:hypothetical protein
MVLTSWSLRRNAILQGTTDNHDYVIAPLPVAPVHETDSALRSRFTMQPVLQCNRLQIFRGC